MPRNWRLSAYWGQETPAIGTAEENYSSHDQRKWQKSFTLQLLHVSNPVTHLSFYRLDSASYFPFWLCPNRGTCRRPPPPQKWSDFYERCGIYMLNRMKNEIQIFSDFYFSSYENSLNNWGHKNDHSSKNKNRKIDFSFYQADCGSFM